MDVFPLAIGPTGRGRSVQYLPERTVNLFPEVGRGGKSGLALCTWPGLKWWSKVGDVLRGGFVFKDNLYTVCGTQVYQVNKGGAPKVVGSVGTSVGRVSIDENPSEMMIVDGKNGYIWDGASLDIITDTGFTELKSDIVVGHDTYFIVNKPGTGVFAISANNDGKTWNSLDRTTAEYRGDDIITLASDRELFVFGDYTTQIYTNTGNATFPFGSMRQGRMPQGIVGKYAHTIIDNTIWYVAKDQFGGVFVARITGGTVRVSNNQVDYIFSNIEDVSDAFCETITYQGSSFFLVTFPSANSGFGRTFACAPHAGNFWFELGIYSAGRNEFDKYPMVFHVYFNNKHIIGVEDGTLYELDEDTYTYGDDEIIWRRTFKTAHEERKRIFYEMLEVDMEMGGDIDMFLRLSNDGGVSFGNRISGHSGAVGDYKKRVRFDRLGSAFDRVFLLQGERNAKIYGANLTLAD
jgi:hypothetical protein